MSMTLKTTKNLFFGLSVAFKITIDVRKKSDLSRKNRTTGPPGDFESYRPPVRPAPGHTGPHPGPNGLPSEQYPGHNGLPLEQYPGRTGLSNEQRS